MRTLKVVDIHSLNELRKKTTSIKGYNDVVDWKIIQAVKQNTGITASEIAKVLCISEKKVYKVIQEYNKKGSNYKEGTQWGGRRKETSFMSYEEESKFLEQLSKKAKLGLILTIKDVKKEFEKKIGHEISDDYIWSIFKRHHWTKKSPRAEHPKTDYEKQEEFKKNFLKTWQPPN